MVTPKLERTTLHIENNIAFVKLNRPEALNAFDLPLFESIQSRIQELHKMKKVRAVIIHAEGTDFSTGLDVKSMMSKPKRMLRIGLKPRLGDSNLAQKMCTGWQQLPIPVITCIHGRCWGAGLQLALGADIRIAHPNSDLCFLESKWGLVPDMGTSAMLPSQLSLDKAFLWTATTHKISAAEALSFNLITESAEQPLERAKEIAEAFAARSPDSVSATKRLYRSAYKTHSRKQLAKEFVFQLRLILGKNRKIAVKNARKSENQPEEFAERRGW